MEDLDHAFDLHEIVAFKSVNRFRDVVPHLGVQLAGAVPQQNGKV